MPLEGLSRRNPFEQRCPFPALVLKILTDMIRMFDGDAQKTINPCWVGKFGSPSQTTASGCTSNSTWHHPSYVPNLGLAMARVDVGEGVELSQFNAHAPPTLIYPPCECRILSLPVKCPL